jgi:uncharacterized membrane protein YfcA
MILGLLLVAGGAAAGLFGSLLGLGGGILIVPLLTLAFGLPLLTAVGISLICVIVTSSAAAHRTPPRSAWAPSSARPSCSPRWPCS